MPNASRDENNIPTLLGVEDTDIVPTPILADPVTHSLSVENSSTGTDNGRTNALKDENGVPSLLGVSRDDGVTPVPIYANDSGQLLIDSN